MQGLRLWGPGTNHSATVNRDEHLAGEHMYPALANYPLDIYHQAPFTTSFNYEQEGCSTAICSQGTDAWHHGSPISRIRSASAPGCPLLIPAIPPGLPTPTASLPLFGESPNEFKESDIQPCPTSNSQRATHIPPANSLISEEELLENLSEEELLENLSPGPTPKLNPYNPSLEETDPDDMLLPGTGGAPELSLMELLEKDLEEMSDAEFKNFWDTTMIKFEEYKATMSSPREQEDVEMLEVQSVTSSLENPITSEELEQVQNWSNTTVEYEVPSRFISPLVLPEPDPLLSSINAQDSLTLGASYLFQTPYDRFSGQNPPSSPLTELSKTPPLPERFRTSTDQEYSPPPLSFGSESPSSCTEDLPRSTMTPATSPEATKAHPKPTKTPARPSVLPYKMSSPPKVKFKLHVTQFSRNSDSHVATEFNSLREVNKAVGEMIFSVARKFDRVYTSTTVDSITSWMYGWQRRKYYIYIPDEDPVEFFQEYIFGRRDEGPHGEAVREEGIYLWAEVVNNEDL
ncbi:hypothetical protein ABW19_dt0203181 [Dactylella cylindrospora]|nr:hypothetical protein ABW19_dt0203181 [Dactylella cylindrospora]